MSTGDTNAYGTKDDDLPAAMAALEAFIDVRHMEPTSLNGAFSGKNAPASTMRTR
ncbi:MAG: hypothetical protein WCC90_00620 [Methylocella sp.]